MRRVGGAARRATWSFTARRVGALRGNTAGRAALGGNVLPPCSHSVPARLRPSKQRCVFAPGADLASVIAANGEVWVAGVKSDTPLVERWDGHQWTTLPAPWPRIDPAAAGTVGRQPSVELAVTPTDEVWIAATVVGSTPPDVVGRGQPRTLRARRRGRATPSFGSLSAAFDVSPRSRWYDAATKRRRPPLDGLLRKPTDGQVGQVGYALVPWSITWNAVIV